MIVIVDYGMGNLGSIKNILHKIGVNDVEISRDKGIIKNADKLILPGVGAFDAGMQNLEKYNLVECIQEAAVVLKKPLLGICLGMQLLGRCSEEGKRKGLELIPFSNQRFRLSNEYKIPHMGWNYTQIEDNSSPLVKKLDNSQRYYFVHSYYAVCDNDKNVVMSCEYGYRFAAAVSSGNIYGVQFHPEKSHQYGMRLLKNFVEEC